MNAFEKIKYTLLILIGLLIQGICLAQNNPTDTLTVDAAIAQALENSHLIQISKKYAAIESNNATLGNAGYLPQLNVNAGSSLANVNIQQKVLNQNTGVLNDITRNGVQQSNINGSIGLNWTIFDGFRRNAFYKRLKETYLKANTQTKLDIESVILSVSEAYFELAKQQEITRAYQNNLALYEERMKLAEARFQHGFTFKYDVLITKIDINEQKALLIQQNLREQEARFRLNKQLNLPPNHSLLVSRSLRMPALTPNIGFTGTSTLLKNATQEIQIAKLIQKENQSAYLPQLDFVTGFNFTQNRVPAGLSQFNQNYGPVVGLNLVWNVFDGMNKSRIKKNQEIQINISEVRYRESEAQLKTDFQVYQEQLNSALDMLKLQEESQGMALENQALAKERYKEGKISLFEFKETQRSLEDISIQRANTKQLALLAELRMKQINGMLIENKSNL